MSDCVIAVDPGREKCGVAVMHKTEGILHKQITATATLAATVQQLAERFEIAVIALGDRTSSSAAKDALTAVVVNGQQLDIVLVNEHRSTEEARCRYWRENPPQSWRRLLPLTMQIPPKPVDDYVAIVLAERYFQR